MVNKKKLIYVDAIPYCNYDLDNYHSFRAVEDDVINEMPTVDAIETDAIMEEMYDFYQKTVAHAGPSKVDYIDGVYALMDHMARWFEQKESE